MEWTVRKASEEDILSLSTRLREADVKEILYASGENPETVLMETFKEGQTMWVGCRNNIPHIIYGVVPSLTKGVGLPWMVCTDELKASPMTFMRTCREWVSNQSESYPVLTNFVLAENELHIKWLKWCGFKFVRLHKEFGVMKQPFWEFRLDRQKE